MANNPIMEVITPGSHGSTFGGNPVAAVVAMAALDVVKDEKLAENAFRLGELFRSELNTYIKQSSICRLVRGKGLLNAVVINDAEESDAAWNICLKLKENGLLAKPTHGNIIRFAPPLVITEEQLLDCISMFNITHHNTLSFTSEFQHHVPTMLIQINLFSVFKLERPPVSYGPIFREHPFSSTPVLALRLNLCSG